MEEKVNQENVLKIIAELKPLEAKPAELEKNIIAKLAARSISFNELDYLIVNRKIVFSPKILSNIGIVYWGREGVSKDDNSACKLFQYAAQQKDLQGCYSYATYLYQGSTYQGKNLNVALQYVDLAISSGGSDDVNTLLLKARISYELKNYKEANDLIQNILKNKKSTEQHLSQANALQLKIVEVFFGLKQYREALQFFRKIQPKKLYPQDEQVYAALKIKMHERLRAQLDQTFPQVPKSEGHAKETKEKKIEVTSSVPVRAALETFSVSVSIEELKKKGWYRISDQLYGFDKAEIEEDILKDQSGYEKEKDISNKEMEAFAEREKQTVLDKESYISYSDQQKISARTKRVKDAFSREEKSLKEEQKEQLSGQPRKVLRRKREAEECFFDPKRTKKLESHRLAVDLQSNRLVSDIKKEVKLIEVQDVPVRRLVTAEIGVLQASVKAYGYSGDSEWYGTDLGWEIYREQSYYSNPQYYSSLEKVQITTEGTSGRKSLMEAQYQQRVNPHYNHLGDFEMQGAGTIGAMYQTLCALTTVQKPDEDVKKEDQEKEVIQREQALAGYMLRYTKNGTPTYFRRTTENY